MRSLPRLPFSLALAATMFFAIGNATDLTSPEWAAWVQAVGSIGAIWVAYAGIRRQIAHDASVRRRDKQERDIETAHACLHAMDDAWQALRHVTAKMRESCEAVKEIHIDPDRLEEVRFVLRSMIDRDLPPKIIPWVLVGQREIVYSLVAIRQLHIAKAVSQERLSNATRRMKQLERAVIGIKLIVQDWSKTTFD